MLLSRGARLGTYEILDFVGSGGMGEVYLARDSRLQREVAVKVVGRDQVSDPAMQARLLEEARLASTLNHPNICTIHEVGEFEDLTYVVMERVEGRTLKDRIGKDGLPAEVVLRYGKQVAEALAHAHDRGIIHRDLKSSNVMITHDGRVKILDFGLAERVERVDSDRTPSRDSPTGTGGVRGTPAYMSPELLRGEPADPRSDLWSLGVTLYEMASGRLPFTGETPFQLGTAILKDSPSPVPPDVPVALGRIIHHCLAKDPAHRYQRASELAAALEVTEVAGSTMSTGRIAGLAPEKPSTTVRVLAAAGGLAFLAVLSVALWTVFHPRRADVRLANALQLTTAVGVENYPSWRPDGTEVAYESSESGNWDVWIARVDGSERINRTADYEGNDRFPSWSPDGRQIAFWSDRDGGGYYLLSVLGGAVRAIPEVDLAGFPIDQLSPPQWSPDGRDLVVVASEGGATVVRKIDLSSGETRPFSLPGMAGNGRLNLSWSRDGRFLAYVDAVDLSAQVTQIRLFRPSDGESFPVTDGMTSSWSPTWSPDGRWLYFVSNLGGVMDLKRMRVEEDGPRMDALQSVTAGVGMLQAAVSPDGTRVAFAKGRVVANLWRVPVSSDRPATWQDARQLTFEETDIEQVDLAPDGRTLVFSSDRRGNLDLWATPIEGGPLESITSDPAPDWAPRWSPDGGRILFYSYRSGHRDIWVTPRDRPSATALTRGEAEDLYPVWSPDGSAIAFESSRSGNRDIWVMNLKSGDVHPLTTHPGFDILPAWSPDGNWMAFISNRDGHFRLYRAPVEGGSVERLTDVSVGYARWSPDGETIFFTGWAETAGDIWAVSSEGGSPRKVTTLRGRPGTLRFTALATDGDQLVFAWEQNVGDLWVMNLIENDN